MRGEHDDSTPHIPSGGSRHVERVRVNDKVVQEL
jgi:hypothetical protein